MAVFNFSFLLSETGQSLRFGRRNQSLYTKLFAAKHLVVAVDEGEIDVDSGFGDVDDGRYLIGTYGIDGR